MDYRIPFVLTGDFNDGVESIARARDRIDRVNFLIRVE
mgnify:FL=1